MSSSPSPTGPPPWLALALIALTVSLAGYGATLDDGFLQDDFDGVGNALRRPSWVAAWRWSGPWDANWFRPWAVSSWWVEVELFGTSPFAFRATNLAFHALDATLLGLLVTRLVPRPATGWIATALFAAHPFHPEAVTWVAARFDPMCAAGLLWSLLSWMRFLDTGCGWRHLLSAAAGLLFAVGCKESGLALLPFAAVLLLAHPQRASRRSWLGLAAMCALGAGWMALRSLAVEGAGAALGAGGRSVFLSFDAGRAARFLLAAGEALLLPLDRAWVPSGARWAALLPSVLLLTALPAAWRGASRAGALVLAALLALSVLPLASWAEIGAAGEQTRILYMPSLFSVGLQAAGLAALRQAGSAWLRRWALVATLVGGLGWLALLSVHNRKWSAAATLAEEIVQALPERASFEDHVLVLGGQPKSFLGAPLFLGGLDNACVLRRGYPRDGTRELTLDRWEAGLEKARALDMAGLAFWRWDPESRTWSEIWTGPPGTENLGNPSEDP